jgi:hypothetical protein
MNLSRRTLIASLSAVAMTGPLRAQSGTRPASQFALDLCSKICRAVGLSQNFTVLSGNVGAAQARLVGNTRQIVYNEDWLRKAEIASGSGVPALVVLAHEIGHHLNGHTLDSIPADTIPPDGLRFRLREELEADLFAGGITARLNYPLQAGLPAFAKTGAVPTLDHPSRTERENYFKAGWEAAPRATTCPPTGVYTAPAPRDEIINVFTHNENAKRVQSQFRGRGGVWNEVQNGAVFSEFEEVSRDPCGRVLLWDPERTMWVRLTPSVTGFGRGEFNQDDGATSDRVPRVWNTLDFAQQSGPQACVKGKLV